MQTVIIQYNAGNIRSVDFALRRLGVHAEITDDPQKIRKAGKVVFPGVGEASSTMQYLEERGMDTLIKNLSQPVLGICLGLQLMSAHSEEGDTQAMGIFPAGVYKFRPGVKIPHMGWNRINRLQSPLFHDIEEGSYVYFVHSYYAENNNTAIASCSYQTTFAAAMHQNNFFATQFHPEKSGPVGAQILQNFIRL